MYQPSVRSATVGTGKTLLALVAIFSLLLSALAVARPVIAVHGDAGSQPAVAPVPVTGNLDSKDCPTGTFGVTIQSPETNETGTVTFPDGTTATVTITSSDGTAFSFSVSDGLAAQVFVKGGNDTNKYDYSGFPGGGVPHDENLVAPLNLNSPDPNDTHGLSHATFCLVQVVASIDVTKTGPDQSKVGDETDYTVTITNDGDLELFIQSVNDSLAGDLTAAVVAECGSLEVGEVCVFNYTYVPDAEDDDQLINEVTVVANTAADGTGTEASDDGSALVDLFQPGITVDKTGPAAAEVGDVITYDVTITNTSSSDSPNLVFDAVSDTLVGDLTAAAIAECGELEPAEVCNLSYDYTVTAESDDPIDNTVTVETHPDGFTNNITDSDSHQVDVAEELGSITVIKEIGCEICETFTPGFFFNRGENNEGTAFTNDTLPGNTLTIGGETFGDGDLEFTADAENLSPVQEINAYLRADRTGELDGERGLSAQGQLVRQALALHLNVLFGGEECALADLVYTGDVDLPEWVDADENGAVTLDELLAAAQAATDEAEMRGIAEAIDEVNNSGDDDNPVVLECPENTEGTTGAGFNFELYGPDSTEILADSGTTGTDGTLRLDGDPDGVGLVLGDYLLVETENDAGLDCRVVEVTVGEGGDPDLVQLNADGTVSITLTEDAADIEITVINECEQPVEEEEFGNIEIVKEADDDPDESFGFSATWPEGDFHLIDGQSEFSGDLEAGDYTVTETLTAEQIAAGWSLEDIDCGDADVSVAGASVTITLEEGESVTCTFTNQLEEGEEVEEGELEIIKFFCPQEGDDQIFVFGPGTEEPVDFQVQQEHDELPSDEACSVGADADGNTATFTITGDDDFEMTVSTTAGDIITLDLEVGDYSITEEGTGLTADFSIVADGDTAIVVFNYEEGELAEDQGRIKILKFACTGPEGVVFTILPGDQNSTDLPAGATNCSVVDATFQLDDGTSLSEEFTLGTDGFRLIPVATGTYTLVELQPKQGESGDIVVVEGETTTVIVFNLTEGEQGEEVNEGEQPGGGPGPAREGTQGSRGGPREGTLGGNPLPNTAMEAPTGTVPAALLALVMLSGIGAAAYAVRAEERRRR